MREVLLGAGIGNDPSLLRFARGMETVTDVETESGPGKVVVVDG